MKNDMIVRPEINGGVTIYFNGATALYDVILQSEKGGSYQLDISQDGSDFEPLTDEAGRVNVKLLCIIHVPVVINYPRYYGILHSTKFRI